MRTALNAAVPPVVRSIVCACEMCETRGVSSCNGLVVTNIKLVVTNIRAINKRQTRPVQ